MELESVLAQLLTIAIFVGVCSVAGHVWRRLLRSQRDRLLDDLSDTEQRRRLIVPRTP